MILFIVFIDLLGFGLIIPQLPFVAQNLGASVFEIGVLGAAFPLMQIIWMPLWGKLYDRWGEKNIFIISLSGTVIAFLLFAYSQSLSLLILSRLLAGATAANLGVAKAVLTNPEDSTLTHRNMGRYSTSLALGFLVGPVLGSLLMKVSLTFPAYFAAALSFLALILVILKYQDVKVTSHMTTTSLFNIFEKIKPVKIPLVIYFFLNQSFAGLYIGFPLLLQKQFGFSSIETGYYFILIALLAVFTQGVVFPRFKASTSVKILSLLHLLLVVCTLAFPWANNNSTMIIVVSIWVILFSLALPTSLFLIGHFSLTENKGVISGVSESVNGLARLTGSLLMGVLISATNFYVAFSLCALLLLVNCFLSRQMKI